MVLFGFAFVQRCKHSNYSGYQGIFKGVGAGGGGGGGGGLLHTFCEKFTFEKYAPDVLPPTNPSLLVI